MDFTTALSIAKDSRGSNETAYREAVEFLIDNRAELKSRLYVLIPGGMTSNTDPTWDKVRQNTDSRCGCGNERTLMPLNIREKYEPGETLKVGYKDKIYIRPKGSDKESCVVSMEVVCFQDGPEEAARPKGQPAAEPPVTEPAAVAPATEASAAEAPTEQPVAQGSISQQEVTEDAQKEAPPEPRTYGLRMLSDPFGPIGLNALLDALAPKAMRLDKLAEMEDTARKLLFVQNNLKLPVCDLAKVDPTTPEVTIVLDADMEVFDPTLEPDRHFVQMAVMTISPPSEEQGTQSASPAEAEPATEPTPSGSESPAQPE